MSPDFDEFVLPRPGEKLSSPQPPPIPGPTEQAFTETFGTLLPSAKYINTPKGNAAYYELLPSSARTSSQTPDRVLLIHGIQTPALGMFPLARALHTSFPTTHFVLLDNWGHGLSDTPVLPFEPSLFLELIDALLDRLGWPTVHLIGFSFGGALAVRYTASRTKRVQSLVLVAPAGLIPLSGFSLTEKAHLRGGGDEAAARDWILEWLGGLSVPADWKERVAKGEIVSEAVRSWQMRENPGHTAAVVAVFRDGGVMDSDEVFAATAKTGVPIVAVLGETDDVVSQEQLNKLGFGNVAVVPDAGHEVVRKRVPEVAKHVSDFWANLNGWENDRERQS